MAVPAADIYYNKLMLDKCLDISSNITTVIFDMYDYTFFNIDTSRGKYVSEYFAKGGFLDANHLKDNHNYNKDALNPFTIESYLMKYHKYDVLLKSVMKKLFLFTDSVESYRHPNKWGCISDDPMLQGDVLLYGKRKRYKDTILENKQTLRYILSKLNKRNIRLIITLLPRYCMMEELLAYYYADWRKFFINTISELQKEFKFEFLDYKKDKSISGNNHFYMDPSHLNMIGAYAMTSRIIKDIF